MLELSDKDFRAAIIKMFQWTLMNMLETNLKNRKFQKKKERKEKNNQKEILELKKYYKQNFKNSMNGLKSRMGGTEKRINVFEDKRTEIPSLNNR